MTVAVASRKLLFPSISGSTGPFSFSFRILLRNTPVTNTPQIKVTKYSSTGVPTDLTYITDYTFVPSNGGINGGTVTLLVAGAAGESLFISGNTPKDQPIKYSNQGRFFPEVHEQSYDQAIMINQEQQQDLDRALKFPLADASPGGELPIASLRANKGMKFDASGNVALTATDPDDASTYAAQAAASAVLAASTFRGTSVTSNSISVASKSFTTQTNKNFQAGQYMTITDAANNANWMFGRVTSYNNGTGALVFDSQIVSGSGTIADWLISISGIRGITGATGSAGSNGTNGSNGTSSVWLQGAGVPSGGLGNNTDMYLNTTNYDVYGPKSGGAWGSAIANIKGVTGAAGSNGTNGVDGIVQFRFGSGVPSGGLGNNGDAYFNTANGDMYLKAAGAWGLQFNTGAGVSAGSIAAPTGRLTLSSGTPVQTSILTAQTSVYYAPYVGDQIPIYNGSNFVSTTYTQLTLTLNTSNHLSTKLYDLFVWNDAGTIRLGAGPAWTNNTTRSAAIARLKGLWTNNATITLTNGATSYASIPANQATYVGTIYCTANGQTEHYLASNAESGGDRYLGVYNAYNRVRSTCYTNISSSSWSYASGTVRVVGGSTCRVNWVDGLSTSIVNADGYVALQPSTVDHYYMGIGLNSETTHAQRQSITRLTGTYCMVDTQYTSAPLLGLNYLSLNESTSGGSVSLNVNAGIGTSGYKVELEM